MNSELVLPRILANQILAHARQHQHTESCGLISGSNGSATRYYAVKNIATDPSIRFVMDPGEQIAAMKRMREQGEDLLAIVHSHPTSPAVPSATDMQEVSYPDAYYIIVSLNPGDMLDMRAYRIAANEFQPVELHYQHEQ